MSICELTAIKTDLKNKSYICDTPCKQGDTLILNFEILDNYVMADLTGFACMLKANKADGKGYEIRDATITVSTGKVRIQCPSSLTQFAGTLLLELTFVDTVHNLQKTSFDIEIQVDKSVIGNSDGSVPTVIITALEELNADLAQIESAVAEAKAINTTLSNTNSTANSLNTTLNSTIGNANNAETSLNSAREDAEQTIIDLQNINGEYTQHIHNLDIHVTKAQKIKWDGYEAQIAELTSIIENFIFLDALVVDDLGNNVVDDLGNTIIV